MSIIAIGGVKPKMSLSHIIKLLAPSINGHFEALNFGTGKQGTKICYIRLSEKLDPLRVIEKINLKQTSSFKPQAYMPKRVPDLPLASKLKTIPNKLRQRLKIPVSSTRQLIAQTYNQILREMQAKYTGLYELNKEKNAKGHPKLIYTIGQEVYNRLLKITQTCSNTGSVFLLSKAYRKTHPHFGDFQFILSTLHQLQDEEGKPRVKLQESELTAVGDSPCTIDNISYDKIKVASNKYLDKITGKVLDHVNNLSTKVDPNRDHLEEAIRIKVREQMKKLVPYLPSIINQVVKGHFLPQESEHHIVHIYGEPFLPGKEEMRPWLKRHRALGVTRDTRMFNLIAVKVPRGALVTLLAADGALIGDSKLVIRPSDVPIFRTSINEFIEHKIATLYPQK